MADDRSPTERERELENPGPDTQTERSSSGIEASDETARGQERPRPGRRPLIALAAVVVVLMISGGWYYLSTRNQETTDDAFTDGNTVTIAPKVEGYVVELNVNDNTRVEAGDLMVRIDPRPFVAARVRADLQRRRRCGDPGRWPAQEAFS
jgi:membrane fusion protein (multidrug efflux system)